MTQGIRTEAVLTSQVSERSGRLGKLIFLALRSFLLPVPGADVACALDN